MGLRKSQTAIHKDRIYLGKIIKPHGLRGEVKFSPFGCDPWFLEELIHVNLETPDREMDVEYVRGTEKEPIVKFRTVDDRNDSEALVGARVWILENRLPELEDNCYYESDFLYARVVTVSGEELGQVQQIIETGECDVLVVRNSSGDEVLLPANREVVKEIRKNESTLVVNPPVYDDSNDAD